MTASLTASGPTSAGLSWKWPRGAVPPLAAIRQCIADWLAELGRDVVTDVQLVCTELVTNVHQHARSAGRLRIVKRAGGRVVRVEVDDQSPNTPVVAAEPAANAGHGRGLLIVNRLAKRWGVRRTSYGKTVWADLERA